MIRDDQLFDFYLAIAQKMAIQVDEAIRKKTEAEIARIVNEHERHVMEMCALPEGFLK